MPIRTLAHQQSNTGYEYLILVRFHCTLQEYSLVHTILVRIQSLFALAFCILLVKLSSNH